MAERDDDYKPKHSTIEEAIELWIYYDNIRRTPGKRIQNEWVLFHDLAEEIKYYLNRDFNWSKTIQYASTIDNLKSRAVYLLERKAACEILNVSGGAEFVKNCQIEIDKLMAIINLGLIESKMELKNDDDQNSLEEYADSFETMFYNPEAAELSLQCLRDLKIINDANVYIGKNKGIFPLWARILKNYPTLFKSSLKDLQIKNLLNQKIYGLNLSVDASEFRKNYRRVTESKVEFELRSLFSRFSQFSQSSQKGKGGK